MNNFIVRYQNGESKRFQVSPVLTEHGAKEYAFTEEIDFTQVKQVDFPLHDFEIKAGDEGFFLLPSGNKGCKNREYALGYFRTRDDEQAIC